MPPFILRYSAPLQSTAASFKPLPDIVIDLKTVPVGYDFDNVHDCALSMLVHMLDPVLPLLLMPSINGASAANTTLFILPEKPGEMLHDPPPSVLVNNFPAKESATT